jgi:uncharacterized membrane protein YhaH (DUF805 family)
MHDLTPLYEYIHTQRRAGVADGTTYHSLITAGWSPEVVSHAMNNRVQQPIHQPTTQHIQNNQQPYEDTSNHTNQTYKKGLFKGRIRRLGFLVSVIYAILFALGALGLNLLIGLLLSDSLPVVSSILGLLLTLAAIIGFIVLYFSALAKRWHDVGQSGWFVMFNFIPFAAVIILVALLFVPGEKTANKYGQLPSKSLSIKSIFGF